MNLSSLTRVIFVISFLVCCSLTMAQTTTKAARPEAYTEDVIIAPGDKLRISYIDIGPQGSPIEKSSIVEVRPNGTIFHELVGEIYVQNLSISQAEEALRAKFGELFTRPQVAVNIIEKTMIKIFLWGAVANVGVYPVQPHTTIAEFIMQHGTPTAEADISKITISRDDGSVVIFDLTKYLFNNEKSANIELKNNDKVIVPRAYLAEEYSRLSRNYILKSGNIIQITISELSGIAKSSPQPENYTIDKEGNIFHKRFGAVRIGGLSIDKAEATLTEMAKRYYREPVVKIEVVQISSRNVFVFGQVNHPGIYPLEGNVRLAEFLANIGGLTQLADLDKIIVTRENAKSITFSLNDYLFKRHDDKNIYLEDGDRIVVLSRQRGFFYRLAEKLQPFSVVISLIASLTTVYVIITYR